MKKITSKCENEVTFEFFFQNENWVGIRKVSGMKSVYYSIEPKGNEGRLTPEMAKDAFEHLLLANPEEFQKFWIYLERRTSTTMYHEYTLAIRQAYYDTLVRIRFIKDNVMEA